MVAKLFELFAVEADLSNQTQKLLEEANSTLGTKAERFKGHTKEVKFFDTARSGENTSEQVSIVTTVDEKLDHVVSQLVRHWDLHATRESTNQTATADLIVDGKVYLTAMPNTFYLGMESRLLQMRNILENIPTLAPAIPWVVDENQRKGIYRSPVMTDFRQEKQIDHKIVAPATDKHPAQIVSINIEPRVAKIETTHFSGMWTPAQKARAISNVDKLIAAVKQARTRANTVDQKIAKVGSILMDVIFEGVRSK